MQILRNLPFSDAPGALPHLGNIVIRPYQIVVWVSVSASETLDPEARRFPAVLDTGHNHNFSLAKINS